ncbi:MAG: CBS domain-containing protein [Crenarchaeota archaeon]|nr:CBS domain-containing protein [Thermoproteota archaeon]
MAGPVIQAAVLVGALLFASKLGEEVAERLGYPGFLGSVLVGVLLSQAVLGLVTPSELETALLLFILGINFTLFLAGVEELSNPSLLKPSLREVLLSSILLAAPTLMVALFSQKIWGLGLEASLALGVTMSIVSAGPLMKLLLAKGRLGEQEAAILRIGLLAEVGGLIVFNSLVQGFTAVKLAETALFVVAVYAIGRRYLDNLLVMIERHMHVKEAPFAIIVSLVTMTGYLAEMIGFNAAVTALLLGVFMSEYMEIRPFYLERIKAFTYGFLEPLFFIGIGIYTVRPSIQDIGYAAALLALSGAPKLAVGARMGLGLRGSLPLLAKGGVDAALLLALLNGGHIDNTIFTSALLAVVASTIIASSGARIGARAPDTLRRRLAEMELDMDIVEDSESAEYAARIVANKGAAVVVDKYMRPIGYVTAEDFVDVDPAMLRRIPIRYFMRSEVPIVRGDATLADILGDVTLVKEPIIAVVNEKGEVIGTITPRKLLSLLVGPKAHEESRKRIESMMDYTGVE